MYWSGLTSVWDSFSNFLKVDINVNQDQTPDVNKPVIIKFAVINTSQHEEFKTDVVFEEVNLKVGLPPNWHTEKAKNLSCGQTFSYEYHCNYDEIMKVQWTLDGKVSPDVLLTFHKNPSYINKNNQLPVKAYFDFLKKLNIHRWMEQIKSFSAPNQNNTLAEMKEKERTLNAIISDLGNSGHQLQEFLGLVNTDRYRDDINRHKTAVVEYLNKAQREIGELIQQLRTHDIDRFEKARDNIVVKLNGRASELDEATAALGQKLGILTRVSKDETIATAAPKMVLPPAISLKEIDLHNNPNIEEAIPILEKFIRESYKENVRSIRVIHGKGIGVLRNAVRLHLESHKLIKSVNPTDKDHGGDGATEAILVDYVNLLQD